MELKGMEDLRPPDKKFRKMFFKVHLFWNTKQNNLYFDIELQ